MICAVITLRPFREDELGYFDDVVDPTTDPYNFFGFRSSGRWNEQWRENGLVRHLDGGTLAVDLDGELIGDVGWRPVSYGPAPVPVALDIGITLLTAHRGQGHGSVAQRQLGDHLFAVYAVYRLEASTDVSNIGEQRALVKAGFTREGVLRGAQFRAGRYRDLVGYSRLRDDNPDVQHPDPAR